MRVRSFLLLILVISCTNIPAQEASNFPPPEKAPVVYATEASTLITIDGKLTEPVWQTAPIIKDFFRMEPRQGGTYSMKVVSGIVLQEINPLFQKSLT